VIWPDGLPEFSESAEVREGAEKERAWTEMLKPFFFSSSVDLRVVCVNSGARSRISLG
jgi:hypothetical protein